MEAYLSLDGLRAGLVLVGAVAQVVMARWPEIRGLPASVQSRSAAVQLPITPFAPAFAIWAVIFAASLAFALCQALPAALDDPLLRTLGWLAAAAFLLNAAWERHVPTHHIDWTSFALILLALVALLGAMVLLGRAEPLEGSRFWLVAAPLQLLAGWISAATFVNLGSTLKWSGVTVGTGLCLILLGCAGGLGILIAAWSASLVYAGAVAWALLGIVAANLLRDRNVAIGAAAALLSPVVIGAAWWSGT